MSRVGLKSIPIPEKVTVKNEGGEIEVQGPKGKLAWNLPEGISMKEEEGNLSFIKEKETRALRALHGTTRSIVNNMVLGVNVGYSKDLEIQGVGFRAAVKGDVLDLSLGKSHPILHKIPEGIKVTVSDNTKIKVEGIDKQQVGQFAADIRAYYPPEPYKGKGVRYVGEYVRRKAGKSVAK